jgi:glycerol-1-phosphate dehydrogenase [NAD(P)+]
VQQFIFSDFISRFDANGELSCSCGEVHHLFTRSVIVSSGALEESARLLADSRGRGVRLWVLSDENTEAAAASRWKSAVHAARIVSRVLPGRPRVHPTEELAQELAREAGGASVDLVVAIGSGVISDLGKRISLLSGIPNWCIATAPSVDAYGSATAAITINGYHGAVPCKVSEVIVADLEVIGRAPRVMFHAGMGDLLAKFLAHLDWNLSHTMTGETYCPLVAGMALESARAALQAARGLDDDPVEATRTLTDAALSSSFAMQATGGSRPAASAEHTLAHHWETSHSAGNETIDLHGILAGTASRVMLPLYEAFYRRLEEFSPDVPERLRAYDNERPWRESLEHGLLPFLPKIAEEMAERTFNKKMLADRLSSFPAHRSGILQMAREMLGELSSSVRQLEKSGCPLTVGALGIKREAVLLPLRNIRLLRRRYSSFDLAYELGLEEIIMREAEKSLASNG